MYKMVCSKICFLFIVFGMVQIQLRWKRDDVVRFKPWRVAFKGHTTDVQQKTVAPIEFQKKKLSARISYKIKQRTWQREKTDFLHSKP